MGAILSQVITNVRTNLQIRNAPNDTVGNEDIMKAVNDAATQFSSLPFDCPAVAVKEYLGNDEMFYPLPADWDDLSRINSIFFNDNLFAYGSDKYILHNDVDTTERACSNIANGATTVTLSTVADAGFFKKGEMIVIVNGGEVAENNWCAADGSTSTGQISLKNAATAAYSSTPKIRKRNFLAFTDLAPSVSQVFRLSYTKTHSITDDASTIQNKHQAAFDHLAAALVAYAISAKYANTQSAIPDVDVIDYGNKSELWRGIADKEMSVALEQVNVGTDKKTETAAQMRRLQPAPKASMNILYPA